MTFKSIFKEYYYYQFKKEKPLKFEIRDENERKMEDAGRVERRSNILPKQYFCRSKSLKLWRLDQGEEEE